MSAPDGHLSWWQAIRFLWHLRQTKHWDQIVYSETTGAVFCKCLGWIA